MYKYLFSISVPIFNAHSKTTGTVRNDIQNAMMQYIIDLMVDALVRDPRRKVTYVKIGFFYHWWKQQSDDIRIVER